MSEISPLPWQVTASQRSDRSLSTVHVVDADWSAVAQVSIYSTDRTLGNAHLLAAAPDLYAAAANAEAIMSIVEPRSDKAEYLTGLNQLRAALRKARGEAPE